MSGVKRYVFKNRFGLKMGIDANGFGISLNIGMDLVKRVWILETRPENGYEF